MSAPWFTTIVIAGSAGLASSAIAADGLRYVCVDKTVLTAAFHTSPASAVLVFSGSDAT